MCAVFVLGSLLLSPLTDSCACVRSFSQWVGLSHTFAGGCGFNGDYVDDTPLEDWPDGTWDGVGGCPDGRDSCPDAAGLDPIREFFLPSALLGYWCQADVG